MKKKTIFLIIVTAISLIAIQKVYPNFLSTKNPSVETWSQSTNYAERSYGNYTSGAEIENYKFSLNYPTEWHIFLEKDKYMQQYDEPRIVRFNFSLLAPNVTSESVKGLWGGFNVDVYGPYNSIDDWMNEFINLLDKDDKNWANKSYFKLTELQIGNKKAYFMTSDENAPDFIRVGFAPRYVVLGKYYSYIIGFFPNGVSGSHERIKIELFPTLRFE